MNIYCPYRVFYLTIVITIHICNATGHKYSKTLGRFPPMYDFDDYDVCLRSETSKFESTYCMVYAEIIPQNSSKLWREISHHIKEYKFHYRRDRLFFGVCMERCKNFPNTLDNFQYNDSKVANQITKFFEKVHKRPLDLQMRSNYQELVHNCINSAFHDKYGLSVKTFIEYCESPEETTQQDGLDKYVLKFLQIILILNIMSTVYDFCLKRKQPIDLQNADFYKMDPQQPVSRLLTAFSVRRNYYRLVQPSTSELGKNFTYLDGIRSFCVTFVVYGHAFFVQYHHVKNPDDFENFAKSLLHLGLTNGTIILEIFHVLSGMLLLIKFKETFKITAQSSAKDCVKTFCKGMLMRYIRFLPSLVLFVFVHATIFTRFQDGPFWRHLTEPARTFGRDKWLKNLLTVDNISESGFPHTWYMTTDLQLFAFYFGIVILLNKYPQYKSRILAALAIFAVVIPFTVSFIHGLEACFLTSAESFRFTHVFEEESFLKLYTPFYTNLGGYLFGIVCGEIYENYFHNEDFCRKISRIPAKVFEFVFWLCIAVGIWGCWQGAVVVFKQPSVWTALYAGLNRNLWLMIVGGATVVLGMFCQSLWIMDTFRNSIFRVLARLSFQAYIWHFSILYLINGHKRQPVYTNHLRILSVQISMYFFSMALAFVVTIFFEYPFHKIANYCYKKEFSSKPLHLKS